jgi:hypothetical protein
MKMKKMEKKGKDMNPWKRKLAGMILGYPVM